MKELSLKEIQALSLEILIDVAEFCEKNGIHYSLAYGTCLGAVRHKGFIPWDDDVDVQMLREDYERFARTYRSERFKFFDSSNMKDCWIPFGRVCDCERTVSKTNIPWHGGTVQTGLWIDIFPVDKVTADHDAYERLFKSLVMDYEVLNRTRKAYARPCDCATRKGRVKVWKLNHLHRRPKFRPEVLVGGRNEVMRLTNMQKESQYYSVLCCTPQYEECKHESLFGLVRLEFEGRQFECWSGSARTTATICSSLPPPNASRPSTPTSDSTGRGSAGRLAPSPRHRVHCVIPGFDRAFACSQAVMLHGEIISG